MMNVAILSDQSLLTQGIISRLHNSAPSVEVQMVEIDQPDVFEKLVGLQPDVVILESKELVNSAIFPMNQLFSVLPQLVIMEVNIETSDIQIIRSNQYAASGITDMLKMLQNANGGFPGVITSM
jgi:chemotaxis response regulator CheB